MNEDKKKSILRSIHEAARRCAEMYFEYNSDDDSDDDKRLSDGRIKPNWLDEGYGEQVSEWLFGDNQADDIILEEGLFVSGDFEGKYGKGNMWNLLEKYFDNNEVEGIFYEEWHKFLEEKYGSEWRNMNDSMINQ